MAVESFSSPSQLAVNLAVSFRKPIFGRNTVILGKGHLPVKQAISLDFKVKSSLRNQVFEDPSNGIICYEDDNGEIICEGFDEGPRVHDPIPCPPTPYHLRDANILDHVPQTWLGIFNEKSKDDGALREKHACNGFNTFY